MAFGHQKEDSRLILLREISQEGRIPRIDLAQRTGISRATVTTITADLLRDGLIAEVPRDDGAASTRGRPRVDLKIAGSAHLVAGVKVSGTRISLVLMDFEGTQLVDHEAPLAPGRHSPAALAGFISDAVATLAAKAGHATADISGVGVGLAGTIDAGAGAVHWSPSLNARNVDFAADLTAQMGVPAYLDNDANLVAMAEKAFGLGRGRSDFIVVTLEAGVGMGIILGGEIYRGTRGCGAEFGHTKVQLEGALCRCGQRGCLEAYVAEYALLREADTALGPDTSVASQIARLLEAAEAGDSAAASIVARAGRMFAMGLANIVNIFDPELIILAGEQMQFDYLYSDAVMAEMRKSIVQVDAAPPEVVIHKWGNLMWARGAAAYALEFVQERAAREGRVDAD
ncbi:ROK family transcriptional regulator [Pseudosulfitobacter sp. DSM 107133]|jgi:predicted NBD/HSP70 family sugar kinase|uniref:ROK family transcriptional regulator n=1 Tax=Pseudosulfitobacter sp. DSM 107133 TaxID=2883100 RepID=UPI000DF214B4|nr:ROK family transcriptional regulator [Pseudosulfitobacter sp. DSM 107133]UOA25877.1 N-acetylglucosamine repressor [Pseudosulfitobacter sp. DSM 107133]